ncbi:hypothetical protein ACM66T_10025 [Sulfurimonas sp. ST-25]|uniref:hypothetical protein n=1 Tax=Sulfurimonas sp. ST-25 TaxID=3400151 RepID=UPI003A8BAE30
MKKFCIGDEVVWTSQSGGFVKKKAGRVVFILQGDIYPRKIAIKKFPGHKRMFDGYTIPESKSGEAYLIEVWDGKTDRAKPKLYMPRPDTLKEYKV